MVTPCGGPPSPPVGLSCRKSMILDGLMVKVWAFLPVTDAFQEG